MAHRLTPTEYSSKRSLHELIRTLRESFPVVTVDRERGSDHLGDMIAHLIRVRKGYTRWKEPPDYAANIDTMIERLDRLRNNAAFMVVAAVECDDDQCITFNLVPGEAIMIGYANQKHKDMATPISLRVAEVLGYNAEEI